ncbi:hypothetical protein [Pontibacter kalidii]|uniref:hypothetical protein n=1 Tax=Pontibacter kalidii TaxID=2592049 RepID=UPI00225BBC0E|nr:hypothetical protein [Pontibacter kalidii]
MGLGLASFLLLFPGGGLGGSNSYLLYIPLLLLPAWLLPAMNKRAALAISGAELPKSVLHFYYMGAEVLKIALLVSFGISML